MSAIKLSNNHSVSCWLSYPTWHIETRREGDNGSCDENADNGEKQSRHGEVYGFPDSSKYNRAGRNGESARQGERQAPLHFGSVTDCIIEEERRLGQ